MSITLDATLPSAETLAEVYAITATSHTLADSVMDVIQDASYTYADIVELFNEALLEIAGELLLPDLETWDDVTTDPHQSTCRLPANFHRNLRYAHSYSHNREVKVYGSRSQLYRRFGKLDQVGQVIGVARQGRNLFYQRVPSTAETLRIQFWRFPERLESRHDKPTCIPWHLAKPLLKHYACKELFSEIEDGQDGNKTNTAYHEKRFAKAQEALELFIGPEEHPPVMPEEEIDWDALH